MEFKKKLESLFTESVYLPNEYKRNIEQVPASETMDMSVNSDGNAAYISPSYCPYLKMMEEGLDVSQKLNPISFYDGMCIADTDDVCDFFESFHSYKGHIYCSARAAYQYEKDTEEEDQEDV